MGKKMRMGGAVLGLGVFGCLLLSLIIHREMRGPNPRSAQILQVQLPKASEEPKLALPVSSPTQGPASEEKPASSQPSVEPVVDRSEPANPGPEPMPKIESPPEMPAAPLPPVAVAQMAPAAPMPASAAAHDPDKAAEEFVERTRKEAAAAVDTLTAEATQLRERLAKVEAGLARYRETLEAVCPKAVPPAAPTRSEEPELSPAAMPKAADSTRPDIDILNVPKSEPTGQKPDASIDSPPPSSEVTVPKERPHADPASGAEPPKR